jgi:hypothetical protein
MEGMVAMLLPLYVYCWHKMNRNDEVNPQSQLLHFVRDVKASQ